MSSILRARIIGSGVAMVMLIAIYSAQTVAAAQPLQAKMEDGVNLKVHLPEGWKDGEEDYAQLVLTAACAGYREIVFHQGFNRAGYTFSSPARLFAYDNDRTIDIYIADTEAPFSVMQFAGGSAYEAKLFVPADYTAYRKMYNITEPWLELKASLTHELLHIVTYSYNRNIQTTTQGKFSLTSTRWDWYTEALARYFETLVGYREEFLSCGFQLNYARVTKIYKGGVNYFLTYPDVPLEERKYDFALFWQYVHQNYGMDKIEEVSAQFRELEPQFATGYEAMQFLAETLDVPMENLLRNFSLYVYKQSSLAEKKQSELKPVGITELAACGRISDSINSFGLDFYAVDLKQNIKTIKLKTDLSQKELNCVVGIHSPFGFSSRPVELDSTGTVALDLSQLPEDAKSLILMLSNPTDQTVGYKIVLN